MAFVSGTTLYVVLVFTGLSAVLALLSAVVYRKIQNHGTASMAKFQLDPERTKREFMVFWLGSVFMVVGLSSYLYGAFSHETFYLNIGRGAFSLFAVILTSVFYEWWRRL